VNGVQKAINERVQVEQKSYENGPRERGSNHRAFSHRRRHRAIGSLLRKVFGARILALGAATPPLRTFSLRISG